jgi:hypothetical protein
MVLSLRFRAEDEEKAFNQFERCYDATMIAKVV